MKNITENLWSLNTDLHRPYTTFGYYIKAIFYYSKVTILIDYFSNDFNNFVDINDALIRNIIKNERN